MINLKQGIKSGLNAVHGSDESRGKARHLAFGLQLPPNTSVELLQSTKRINQGDALYASYTAGAGNGVSAFVSARYGPAYTIDTFTSSVLPGTTITASFGTSANEGTSLYYTIE